MQTALRSALALLSFIVAQTSFAIDYKFTGSGSWSNPSNWEGGLVPPSTLEAGNTITIVGTTSTGQSCGEYCFTDLGVNKGTITIVPGGSLTLNGMTQFRQQGIIIVQGTLINQTALEGYDIGTISVSGTFVNQVWFGNQGHLVINDGGVVRNELGLDNAHPGGFGGKGLLTNDFINPGKITLNSGGMINNVTPATLVLGNVTNNGGIINNYSILKGSPTITGNLVNVGTIAPGKSPGTYSITGNYTATSSTVHQFEVGGISTGRYDVLKVDGTVNLNGTLIVTLIDGFSKLEDHEITIITGTIKGTFANLNIPDRYILEYRTNSVVLRSIPIQKVTFSALSVVKEGVKGKISWTVENEGEVLSYEVQRSASPYSFKTIGTVALSGTTGAYSFIDENPELSNYYQVKVNYLGSVSSNSTSVHIYYGAPTNTFTGTGNWSDATKWSKGSVPLSVNRGDLIVINGNCNLDIQLSEDSRGQIDILPGSNLKILKPFTNQGVMNINGTLENNSSRFQNLEPFHISGTFINSGYFVNATALFKLGDKSTFINAGTGTFQSGYIETPEGTSFVNIGNIIGTLTFKGNLVNDANLSPGNSPGKLTVQGNYTAAPYARHFFEVEGTTAGTYDELTATGTVNLSGAMNITLKPGVTISGSTEIPLITGTINGKFSSATLPDGLILDYKANSVVLKVATALPVRFVKLEAAKQNGVIQLSWKVADENGVLHYEVEKSTDGNQFTKAGIVAAAHQVEYKHIDYTLNTIAYYRVRSVDADGKLGYSPIVMIKDKANAIIFKAYLAATGNELIVQHPTAVNEAKIYIQSIDGQLLKIAIAQKGTQQSTIHFPFTQSGIYVISYGSEKGSTETAKIFKP